MHFRADLADLPFARGRFAQRLGLLADGLIHRADRPVHLREAHTADDLVHVLAYPMMPAFVRSLPGRESSKSSVTVLCEIEPEGAWRNASLFGAGLDLRARHLWLCGEVSEQLPAAEGFFQRLVMQSAQGRDWGGL